MKIDGACHCGNIKFGAEVDPAKVVICHCSDCQSLSASAFRTVAFVDASTFKLLGAEPKIYIKTAESGNKRLQAFCSECGSGIYATSDEDSPKVLGLRVGVITQRDQLPPSKQIWTSSAQAWVDDMNSLEKVEKQS